MRLKQRARVMRVGILHMYVEKPEVSGCRSQRPTKTVYRVYKEGMDDILPDQS